jgi:hypothetical protein
MFLGEDLLAYLALALRHGDRQPTALVRPPDSQGGRAGSRPLARSVVMIARHAGRAGRWPASGRLEAQRIERCEGHPAWEFVAGSQLNGWASQPR